MKKLGIDDLIAKNGPAVVRGLIAEAWPFDGEPPPVPVHLSEIENASLGAKRIAINLVVSAVGEAFLVPEVIELRCIPLSPKKSNRGLRLVLDNENDQADAGTGWTQCNHSGRNEGRWYVRLRAPDLLIDMTRIRSGAMARQLQEYARGLCPNAQYIGIKSRQTITSFLATPKALRLRLKNGSSYRETVDEAGRPFREKVLFYQGRLGKRSLYFRGIGVAVASPKTQEATAFLSQLEPSGEEFENFVVTPELATKFTAFQAEPSQAADKLEAVTADITTYLTQIYGEHRGRSLLGKLLVFHSVCGFSFDGEPLKRGWLEMLEIGDTGQGKTQQVERLMEATGMGEGVDGVTTTRTGLAYSYLKFNDTWFLVWGKYPLNDGKLLFVDEAQNLAAEDIDKMRKGRSDGVIAAAGVRAGEHPTRTRLIMACNPRFQGVVDDQLFGIELVKQTFKDEDIRRFDFAVISSSSDDKANINEPRNAVRQGVRLISDETLAASVRWAWSRRPEQVVFTQGATSMIYETARVLADQYGEARDIPLLLESDVRFKVARLAVATAALLHSSDENHEQVIVTSEHVIAVGEFLVSIYTNPNCSFDLYAKNRKAEAGISDTDYQAIWKDLRECVVEGEVRINAEDLAVMLRAFITHGGQISRLDLAGELGKTPAWTSKIVRVLKSNQLIRVNRGRSGGYQATPKFNKFLKMAISSRELVT